MLNSGATDTIACNNGDLKLDGDNNKYTLTGHCRRLEVFGSGNHVTVDSADTHPESLRLETTTSSLRAENAAPLPFTRRPTS
jgi:hypothetical protein